MRVSRLYDEVWAKALRLLFGDRCPCCCPRCAPLTRRRHHRPPVRAVPVDPVDAEPAREPVCEWVVLLVVVCARAQTKGLTRFESMGNFLSRPDKEELKGAVAAVVDWSSAATFSGVSSAVVRQTPSVKVVV